MSEHWIDVSRRIVANHQYEDLDGILIDAMTANLLVTVYDNLKDKNQTHYHGMELARAVHIAYKLVKRGIVSCA